MEKGTYTARMRYLDASDVDDALVSYDGLDVYGRDGNQIGNINGFVVDFEARRANYVVIDSGGWFATRRLLLPIGHATIAADRKSLQVDVTQDALKRLPEFEPDRFPAYTDEELRAFERNTVLACCPDEPLEDVSVTTWGYDSRRHYAQPDWWRNVRYAPERLRPLHRMRSDEGSGSRRVETMASSRAEHDRDLVTARAGSLEDVSPHFEGRAQPGDVLGIETAGERTAVGDSSEDENRHRRDAERAARGPVE